MEFIYNWFIRTWAEEEGLDHYDGNRDPILCINNMNDLYLTCSDPNVVQELMTSKSYAIDKDKQAPALTWWFMGEGIVFSPMNEAYKAQRKHLAHAFYKDQMHDMQEIFKQTLKASLSDFIKQIEESPRGEITINISKVANDWFSKNILKIVCGGEEILNELIDMEIYTKEGKVWEKYTISEAIHHI